MNISKYLEKFFNKIEGDEGFYKNITEVLKNKVGIDVGTDDFEVKNNVLYTNFSPGVKNKIFMFKEEIIGEINSASKIKLTDIR